MVLVLFSNALVKLLNINDYKLDISIDYSSKVSIVTEIGSSGMLSRMSKSW